MIDIRHGRSNVSEAVSLLVSPLLRNGKGNYVGHEIRLFLKYDLTAEFQFCNLTEENCKIVSEKIEVAKHVKTVHMSS